MPTVLDAGGGTYPAKDAKGRDVPPAEGRSLLPALAGKTVPLNEPISIEHRSNRAVITEKWKITSDRGEPWRLFNLQADRLERKDLAAANPRIVRKMAAQWDKWARRVGARDEKGWGLGRRRRR